MTPLPLSESPQASPRFSDAAGCKLWLKSLQLAHVALAHTTLTAQLEFLNRSAIAPLERLRISELLREPVAFLQLEMAKKYFGKPVPFEDAQQHAWNSVVALWAAMGAAYRLSLQSCLENDQEVAPHIALVTQRCLRYTGLQMLEHYRAYREIDPALWRQAHESYVLAQRLDYAGRPVKDSLHAGADTITCGAVYARILLADLADPYRLTSKQLAQLDRWLETWAARAAVVAAPPDDSTLARVGVDLAGSAGPVILDGQSLAHPCYLDTDRFASTFRKRIKLLRKGEPPAALGLGEDCVQADCEVLLAELYRHWFEAAPKRRGFTRRHGADKAQLVLGMAAIHFFVGGEKPFKQPGEKEKLSKREIEDLQFYGRISERTEKLHVSQLGFALETWQVLDESALGFRLARTGREGLRIAPKQLVAVRPADSAAYLLGTVKWLILPSSEDFHIGVRILPGAPLAIAAQPVALGTTAHKFAQAFLLPDMPVLRETASLIVPPGWFAPGKLLEIQGSERYTVKLLGLIEKGSDYERVGFVRV
ncbi:MAG: hypothetical protein PHX38_07790 [Sulfuricella sp.]|nr:hypothetical protein [Sulfuricella sp.]